MAKVNGKRHIGRPAACYELPGEDGCLEIFRRCVGMCILCTARKMKICTDALREKIKEREVRIYGKDRSGGYGQRRRQSLAGRGQ